MMKRCKNPWIALMILLSFTASTPILGGGIWLKTRAESTDCFAFLHWPIIAIAVLIMAVSIAGLAGAYYDINFLIYVYVWCTFAIIFLLLVFIFFGYGVTEGTGRPVLNRAYQEFYLQDFYGWLVDAVTAPAHWAQISRCLRGSRVCENLMRFVNGFPETADVFYTRNLSPIQSGCCKPPTACRYVYVNETFWKTTNNKGMLLGAATDRDCGRWSNDQQQLCYSCDSCKAGVMGSVRESWRTASVINLVMLFFLATVYAVACIAFRLKKDDDPPSCETKVVEKDEPSSRYYYSDETKIEKIING